MRGRVGVLVVVVAVVAAPGCGGKPRQADAGASCTVQGVSREELGRCGAGAPYGELPWLGDQSCQSSSNDMCGGCTCPEWCRSGWLTCSCLPPQPGFEVTWYWLCDFVWSCVQCDAGVPQADAGHDAGHTDGPQPDASPDDAPADAGMD